MPTPIKVYAAPDGSWQLHPVAGATEHEGVLEDGFRVDHGAYDHRLSIFPLSGLGMSVERAIALGALRIVEPGD